MNAVSGDFESAANSGMIHCERTEVIRYPISVSEAASKTQFQGLSSKSLLLALCVPCERQSKRSSSGISSGELPVCAARQCTAG